MIRVLDAQVANKIAAGEVIERPANAVKELVENSLDAGATCIAVELTEGGKKLIRITDNGEGMNVEDLRLAFMPHATSKIATVEDLFRVVSYGFRGEALASIGSVSRASIFSRQPGLPLGSSIECRQGVLSEIHEAGGPEGTVIDIVDLFHNTPARRKFLKRDAAEVARVTEVLNGLLLARDDLSISFTHNGRKVLNATSVNDITERVVGLFGSELRDNLITVDHTTNGIHVRGVIGKPEVARASANRQYLHLNERIIRDRGLQQAVVRAFEGFLLPRRHPVFFLRIAMDPQDVDVNAHPTKIEVRFRDKKSVFSAVHRACKQALSGIEHGFRPRGLGHIAATSAGIDVNPSAPVSRTAPLFDAGVGGGDRVGEMQARLESGRGVSQTAATGPRKCSDGPMLSPSPVRRFLQMHDSYILVEDDEGVSFLDQHALHERKLFEELMERAERGDAESQRLLIPAILEASAAEVAMLMANQEDLASFGFEVEPFGETAVAVHAVPVDLAHMDPQRLMDAVLSIDDEQTSTGFADIRRSLLAGIACRAAVKFNDPLDDAAIRSLLDWEQDNPSAAACPHGRPIRLRVPLSELERRFQRKD